LSASCGITASLIAPAVLSSVDAARGRARERFGDVLGFVVDRFLVAEFVVPAQFALPRPACDSDGAAAHQLADLSDGGADRAGGRRDHERVSRARLTQFEQREISGDAVKTKHANRERQRQVRFFDDARDVCAV
jgi:hypothetical protein